MAIHAKNADRIADAVAATRAFTIGNVRGQWYDAWRDVPRGQLVGYHSADVDAPVYVVFSYRTPIAWTYRSETDDSWTVPGVRYSATTTNHLSVVSRGIRMDKVRVG